MMFHRVPGTRYGVPERGGTWAASLDDRPSGRGARTGRLMFGVGVNPDAGIVVGVNSDAGIVGQASKSCHDLEREIEQLRQELHKAKAKLHELSEPRDE